MLSSIYVVAGYDGDVFYVNPAGIPVDQLEEDKNLEPWIMTAKGNQSHEALAILPPR